MAKEIFRKKTLDRLSSPDQLDVLLRVTTPRGWLALLALGLIVSGALVWGFYGVIPTKVGGNGIMIRTGGILEVVATSAGRIKNLYFTPGDDVERGRVVARLDQPEILDRIEKAKDELENLRFRFDQAVQRQLKGMDPQQGQSEDLWNTRLAIRNKERELRELYETLDQNSKVLSQFTGRVIEVGVREGSIVTKGTSLMKIELTGREIKNLEALLYFPAGEGKRIHLGMKAQLSPATVRQEEFGFILGMVTYVSDFPATRQSMVGALGNEELADQLSMGTAPIEVRADLIPDPRTISGFKWSSSSGPPVEIQSGTLCRGTVTISRQRPIDLVLPFLRKRFLGVGQGRN